MLLLIYDISIGDLDLQSGDGWWLLFLCLFWLLDNDRDLLLHLECVDIDNGIFVLVDDSLSLWLGRIFRGGEWGLEWVIASWLVGDSDCIFRGDRGIILEINFGGPDKERDLLLRLIFGTVDDWIVFVVDDRCLVGVKLKLLLLALWVFILEYVLLLLLKEKGVPFIE